MQERAKLQRAAEHWQEKLAYGHGAWQGDRALVLYYKPLTQTMEVWYELPNEKPQLVMKDIPSSEFDIDKMCQALWRGDNRNVSVEDKIDEIDAHNDAIERDNARVAADRQEEFVDRMHHAVRVDTGNHVKPIVVP